MSPELIALITAFFGGVAAIARWAIRLWAEVRREGIATAKEAAMHARADNERMVQALLESARAQTTLAGKIDQLPAMLELVLVGWRDRATVDVAPVEDGDPDATAPPKTPRPRLRTVPHGHRTPKPGRDE